MSSSSSGPLESFSLEHLEGNSRYWFELGNEKDIEKICIRREAEVSYVKHDNLLDL